MNVLIGAPEMLNMFLRRPNFWGNQATANYALSSQAIGLGCQIIVVVFLLRKAEWLASLVFPTEQGVNVSFGAPDLRAVLFSAIGLYFVLDGFRHAVAGVYLLAKRPHGDSQNAAGYLWDRNPENLIRSTAGLLAGALLLIGPGRLKDLGKSVFGRAPETDESPEPTDSA
jgi:hypothetical protein